MTPDQIALVQATFDKIAPIHVTIGALFYRRLFELNPELRPLFHNDMVAQSRKLMDMIALVVDHLSEFESLQPRLRALALAHIGYGARDEHYDTVGVALIWAIRQGLEDQFTPADQAAWLAAYSLLADAVKASAASARLDDPQ
ncbi:MAG TPA: globin domain-containing protein [Roseiflexaceae bacterium]|nr:globin domain-containing protein [Roseiflexaceae bacterium]